MIYLRRIVGDSMLPNFKSGQVVVAIKKTNYKVGQVVVANYDNKEIIKRISKLSNNKVYFLGDNLPKSTDSRHFGWLNTHNIKGQIIFY
jgi:phage repressor protein C with HTH and peptisase S24 domain